jgi:hypothetical protein
MERGRIIRVLGLLHSDEVMLASRAFLYMYDETAFLWGYYSTVYRVLGVIVNSLFRLRESKHSMQHSDFGECTGA